MRSQATRLDLIRRQQQARQRRMHMLFCLPLGVLIVATYTYAIAGLFGAL